MARENVRKHLSPDERSKLEMLYKMHLSISEIAKKLNRNPSTIYRELKRGQCTQINTNLVMYRTYSPETAQRKHDEHMQAKGANLKIGNDIEYAMFLEEKIKQKHSPDVALILAKQQGFKTTISRDTLYKYINDKLFLTVTNKDLIYGKQPQKKKKKENIIPRVQLNHISIEHRPELILARADFGNWEIDTVVGKRKGKSTCLLVMSERKYRYEIIIKIPNKTTQAVTKALEGLKRKYKENYNTIFKTITCDNGTEFANADGIIKGSNTKLYYCHPYSSYERGTNENINRMIRRFIPKGSDISKYTNKQIKAIETWINNYPRKILNWQSANTLYQQELARIMQTA